MEKIIEILGSIGFDWRVALANLVNFAIVFYLLNRFVLKGIKKTLAERKANIEKGLEDSKKAETALIMAKQKEDEIVREAAEKANSIVINASHKGDELIKNAEKKGLENGADMIKKAEQEIERKMKKAEKEAESIAAELVLEGVKKMLIEEVDGGKNKEFIAKVVKKEKVIV
jgi:F-type H+-transporting ATPase subunit b